MNIESYRIVKKSFLQKLDSPFWKTFAKVLQIVIPVSLFFYLLSQTGIKEVWGTLQLVEWKWVLIGFVLFAGLDIWRAIRYYYFLKLKTISVVPATIICGVFNTLLPFRLGELSFPYLLRKCNVKISQSVASLVSVRLIDLLVLGFAILLSWALGLASPQVALVIKVILMLGILFLILGIVLRRVWSGNHLNVFEVLSERFHVPSHWLNKLKSWLSVLKELVSFSTLAYGILISVVIWLENAAVSFFLFKSVGLSLDFPQIFYAFSILQVVALLPINVMGGIGIMDLSWIGFLTFFGISFQDASEATVATRIIFYVYLLVWGGLGWLIWAGVRSRKRAFSPVKGELP